MDLSGAKCADIQQYLHYFWLLEYGGSRLQLYWWTLEAMEPRFGDMKGRLGIFRPSKVYCDASILSGRIYDKLSQLLFELESMSPNFGAVWWLVDFGGHGA